MFGDVGHGSILFIFGVYLCWFHDSIKKSKSGLSAMLSARYLLVLMGIFSTYCGLIYNDCFGIPLSIDDSKWSFKGKDT
jgi:V-type H+-transporting ATPase subunit a